MEKSNILHDNPHQFFRHHKKINPTNFSFFPTVILLTEVTTSTVHPKSCYCELTFLSTGFCSLFYALCLEKSKLK